MAKVLNASDAYGGGFISSLPNEIVRDVATDPVLISIVESTKPERRRDLMLAEEATPLYAERTAVLEAYQTRLRELYTALRPRIEKLDARKRRIVEDAFSARTDPEDPLDDVFELDVAVVTVPWRVRWRSDRDNDMNGYEYVEEYEASDWHAP